MCLATVADGGTGSARARGAACLAQLLAICYTFYKNKIHNIPTTMSEPMARTLFNVFVASCPVRPCNAARTHIPLAPRPPPSDIITLS